MYGKKLQWPDNEPLTIFIRDSKYEGLLPCFYPSDKFPELKILLENWKEIQQEVFEYEKLRGDIKGLNTYSPPELSSEVSWSNIYLENFMWKFHKNRKDFPKTCALLYQIPNCTLAAISVLSPQSTIKPHYGDTNGIIRCHLGLSIPDAYPICGIKVSDEEMGWEEGKIVLFTEAHLHTTWNFSDKRRYLLVIDIVPDFITVSKLTLCSKVLGAQTYNYFEKKIPILKKIPQRKLYPIHYLLSLCWKLYLPLQRRLNFL